MAEDLSILQEIDEALRVDKAQEFWRRHGSVVLICCGLIVASSAASVVWKNYQHSVQAQDTALLMQAAAATQAERYNEAIGFYTKVEEHKGSLATLAALHHAEALASLKQDDKALALYGDVGAGKYGDNKALCDYAAFTAAIMKQNLGGKPAKETLSNDVFANDVFASGERELSALSALEAGDSKIAAQALTGIVADGSGSYSERARAAELLGSVKGATK